LLLREAVQAAAHSNVSGTCIKLMMWVPENLVRLEILILERMTFCTPALQAGRRNVSKTRTFSAHTYAGMGVRLLAGAGV